MIPGKYHIAIDKGNARRGLGTEVRHNSQLYYMHTITNWRLGLPSACALIAPSVPNVRKSSVIRQGYQGTTLETT